MYSRSCFYFLLVAISFLFAGIAHSSDFVVDQRNDNDGAPPTFNGYTTALGTIGQSFAPTFDTLDHVEMYVRAANQGFSSEVHLDIMDSPRGIVLGSSGSQVVNDSFEVRTFHFAPIDISAHASLFIRVVEDFGNLGTQVHAGVFLSGGFGVDDYAGGAAYADEVKGGDFWFRTGSIDGVSGTTTTTTIITTTTITTTTTTPTSTTSTSTTSMMSPTTTLPAQLCGDTDGGGVTATDALRTLQEAVGLPTSCQDCICDVDSSGTVSATDSLRVLQFAVGIDITLNCVPCG